jgi:Na+-transporting NADH:ubiquinone oxidoreductase subunit NqrA
MRLKFTLNTQPNLRRNGNSASELSTVSGVFANAELVTNSCGGRTRPVVAVAVVDTVTAFEVVPTPLVVVPVVEDRDPVVAANDTDGVPVVADRHS